MVRLVPMSEAELAQWLEFSIPEYAQQHVRAGDWPAEEALERARAEHEKILPQGTKTPDQFLFTVRADAGGGRMGELWYALQRQGARTGLFVYWIGIDAAHRRKGYAREVFSWLETAARGHGAERIALHVFGENVGARRLYEELGFLPTNIRMEKRIH